MNSSETSAREKIRRAETHLADLHSLVAAYANSHPYRVLLDPPGDRGVPIANGHRVETWHEPPPAALSTVAGDIVTNLRAALDHVVWGLAKPKDRGSHTSFPIHLNDGRRDRETFARKLKGVPKRAIKAIERMQPYNGPGEPGDQPLAVLNALVNEDKHRSLLTVRLSVPVAEFFGGFGIEPLIEQEPRLESLIREISEQAAGGQGCVVLTDPAVNAWEIQMEVKSPAVQVVTNAAPHREIIDALHELRVVVVHAIDKLVTYLRDDQGPPPDKIKLTSTHD